MVWWGSGSGKEVKYWSGKALLLKLARGGLRSSRCMV